jgi:nucleoside-diphosphate-sugar epimerase
MNILVAGGAGYIGSRLVPELMQRGHAVDVVDLFWFGNHLPTSGKIGLYTKNIFNLKQEDMKQYDAVVFLAGLSNDPMADFSPSLNFIQNGAAPAYLAYIAKKAGVKRFVYASSCSVYGFTKNEVFNESSPTTCDYPYGLSKLQGEKAVLQLDDENFSVIALRKGTVCGWSPRMRLDLLVNTMFKSALHAGHTITVNNPGIWRPILSITDAVSAYVLSIESDLDIHGVFNIAGENCTVGDVATTVCSLVGGRIDVSSIQDSRNYIVSWDKAREVLGFHPTQTVKNIVCELADHENLFNDWDNPLYYNVRVLKENQCAL